MLLQVLSAFGYYLTSPFVVNYPIAAALLVNGGAIVFLWVNCESPDRSTLPHYRAARWVFTLSLFLLELLIGFTESPVSMTPLQGLFNDAEVLFTGILLGVLWQEELLRLRVFAKA